MNTNHKVLIRDIARNRHVYIASDLQGYEPIPSPEIMRQIKNGNTSGWVDNGEIGWYLLDERSIIDLRVFRDDVEYDESIDVRLIMTIEDIDDRYREIDLKTRDNDVVWGQIARAIKRGETSGVIETTSNLMTVSRIGWERY